MNETKIRMDEKPYPNMETMCRLCLKEDAGTVCIFNNEESSKKGVKLSIPMRIMTCTSLEVQHSDAFPNKICTECRYQLEKSYYFRKLSQASDAKLRKHMWLIGMGKASKVFDKKLEEDDYYELGFEESFNFIREQDDLKKQAEKQKFNNTINEMKLQNKQELEKIKKNIRATCREELIPKIKEELREELQTEIKNELRESIKKDVTEECINRAKESLRAEVREECRAIEMKCLLDDLQKYLSNKDRTDISVPTKINVRNRPASPISKNESPPKEVSIPLNAANIEVVPMEISESRTDDQNDEDCDSDGNFLIYDTDEVLDDQKKSSEDKFEYCANVVQEVEYEDEFTEDNIVSYGKNNSDNNETNEESEEITSTTSYQIEDNEDGEIKLLKKCNDGINDDMNEEVPNQKYEYKNIVIINIDEGMENAYVENYEEDEEKHVKQENSHLSAKTKKSSHKKELPSSATRTTSLTSETTFLTKTFVNPMQRSTDTPKIFRCEDCPMVFSTKLSLERHLRTHRKIERTGVTFQCPECRIVVSCSSALRRHMYVHCEEKPFACSVCDKAFVQKEILKRHMQTHTGIKPHQCPHCQRSFAQRINLTQHINRTHLEEPRIQQHSCFLCPKRFNHASGLSRHLAAHSGVAFQCSECDRTFGDRSSIRRHIANMHGNGRASKDTKGKN